MALLSNQLQPDELPLDQIYLDPNNPRFVEANWDLVPIEDTADAEVQESTRRRMVRYFAVDKLKMNMEVNGYLPIDRVIVKEIADEKYIVLEGNRRICAAKMVSKVAADGSRCLFIRGAMLMQLGYSKGSATYLGFRIGRPLIRRSCW